MYKYRKYSIKRSVRLYQILGLLGGGDYWREGAYWKGALIIKIFLLGALIGGRALIGRRALNRIFTVIYLGIVMSPHGSTPFPLVTICHQFDYHLPTLAAPVYK
jgi:hypothetical protein